MRNLLHFGLFVLAFAVVSQASADDDGDYRRGKKVVVRYDPGPRQVRTVRATVGSPRAIYDQRRTFHNRASSIGIARQDYVDQRAHLQQIVRISQRWEWATATQNADAQWRVNRRLEGWLERELREFVPDPRSQRHRQRVHLLRDELARLERSRYRGHGHAYGKHGYRGQGYGKHGYRGQGYGKHGYRGRGHRKHGEGGYLTRKALILDELVRLSEREVERAAANLQYPYRLSFARR